jgi:glycosyltransferase involved in cell wall biosynthesis
MTAVVERRPSVSVVIATRSRPDLLTKAVEAVLVQKYDADVEVLLVFDQTEPQDVLASDDPGRVVRVLRNDRPPGLPGARNTGILAATGDLLAFCDDDDQWLADKLTHQVEAMRKLGCKAVVCGIQVRHGDGLRVRSFRSARLTLSDLVRDRVSAAHPSTYLADRSFVLTQVGLFDEEIPGGYGEDYDWLLRVARHSDVAAVAEPLVEVLWHPGSFFAQRWDIIVEALQYLLDEHPEIRADRRGLARIQGQQAFALAALGRRRESWGKLRLSLLNNPGERRLLATLPVLLRVVSADRILQAANRSGRGV